MAQTLFEKIWREHVVSEEPGCPAVLYVDLHLVHEVTSPQAFSGLRSRGLPVRRPDRTFATVDHSLPTTPRGLPITDNAAAQQIAALERATAEFGVPLFGVDAEEQGIVHVMGPELGLTHPGATIVCGDSHTATHGAFGALAFGIGTSEVEHVLATQCLLQRRPKTLGVRVTGRLPDGVTAKDLILALIAQLGVGGGAGHVLEYFGPAIRALSMEERMTVCNMSIEAGARAGLIAPDDTTFAYLEGRPYAPKGPNFERAVARWRTLPTDEGARFDREVVLDASALRPMITWGTTPGMGIAIDEAVPRAEDALTPEASTATTKALAYMGLRGGQPLLGHPIDVVFIGSCTNSRLSDLQAAARVFEGRSVAPNVRVLVVPGSRPVKLAAEALGLHRVFLDAGAEWREPGCSMCIAMNGDFVGSGQYAVSTSNRNFEGRQGRGARTFLASPETAAAAAVTGCVTDPRTLPPARQC